MMMIMVVTMVKTIVIIMHTMQQGKMRRVGEDGLSTPLASATVCSHPSRC